MTSNLLFSSENETFIDCAIDLNSAKQGRFLPATGLSVVTPKDATDLGIATVIITNLNYVAEMGW